MIYWKQSEEYAAARGRGNGNVEEQEKNQKKSLSGEQIARALQSMKGKIARSDLYEEELEIFDGSLSRRLTESMDRLLKHKEN